MKNNIAKIFIVFIAIATLSSCTTVQTVTYYKESGAIEKVVETPIAAPEVVYPATGTVEVFPVYNTGYGYGYEYYGGCGYNYPRKEKETTKSSGENSYWNYSSPNGRINVGGSNYSDKTVNKWRRK